MALVWKSSVGPASRRLILLALADAANDEHECWPSINTLAAKCCISRTTAEDSLRALEADGLITRVRRYNTSNTYQLNIEAIEAHSRPDRTPAPKPSRPHTTPPEIRGTPEIRRGDPRNLGGGTPEIPGTNPKRTQREPSTTAAADATEQAELPLALPAVPEKEAEDEGPTLNQRSVQAAQWYYRLIGNMGKVPAFQAIIKRAMENGHSDAQIKIALTFIADHHWTLTQERLAHALNGGPQPASKVPTKRKIYLPGRNGRPGMELERG